MPLVAKPLEALIEMDMKSKLMSCTSVAPGPSNTPVPTYPFNPDLMKAVTGVDAKDITYKGQKMCFTDALAKMIAETISQNVMAYIVSNAIVTVVPGQAVSTPAGPGLTSSPGTGTIS